MIPLHIARKGGPPKDTRSLAGSIALVDAGNKGSGDVIAADVPCEMSVVFDAKSPTGRICEVVFLTDVAVDHYGKEYDLAHPDQIREATNNADHHARLVIDRGKFTREAVWWRCKMPIIRALVGKDLVKVAHLVKLAAPAATEPDAKPAAEAAE